MELSNAIAHPPAAESPAPIAHIGDLLHRIVGDLKVIARGEAELIKLDIEKSARQSATDGAVVVLGGMVMLVGLLLASVAAVDALSPLIAPLWARLLIMAAVYLAAGAGAVSLFTKRLGRDAVPDLVEPAVAGKDAVADVKQGLTH